MCNDRGITHVIMPGEYPGLSVFMQILRAFVVKIVFTVDFWGVLYYNEYRRLP
jgi:hypothetical protein